MLTPITRQIGLLRSAAVFVAGAVACLGASGIAAGSEGHAPASQGRTGGRPFAAPVCRHLPRVVPPGTGTLGVSYSTSYAIGVGYTVVSVMVTGLRPVACEGQTVAVWLTGADDADPASGTAPVPADGNTLSVPMDRALPAQDVTRIAVAVD